MKFGGLSDGETEMFVLCRMDGWMDCMFGKGKLL